MGYSRKQQGIVKQKIEKDCASVKCTVQDQQSVGWYLRIDYIRK